MRRLLATLAPVLLLAAIAPAAGATAIAPARDFAPGRVVVKFDGERGAQALALPAGAGVRATATVLRRNPRVAYAAPDYVATASELPAGAAFLVPNDPGSLDEGPGASGVSAEAGDWALRQWDFLPDESSPGERLPTSAGGIDAVAAWRNLAAVGRPGAAGVTVAVLDTGIAYRNDGSRYRRSPDFAAAQFVKGWDFVDEDALPLDENGHGTHVAGTIGEKTDNAVGLTGLAYRAKLMPVRVLDAQGRGEAHKIARGIRFAVAHHANVINMSFNFGCGKRVPEVDEALREAYAKGVVVVASVGNVGSEACVSEPATGPRVIGVGGTTEGGCLGDYSLSGAGVDVVAPGGGVPAAGCPSVSARPIYQVTLLPGSTRDFGIPGDYVGTSMAAAHVSGVAAMILAAGVLGPKPLPERRVIAVTRRLRSTARDIGLEPTQQGAGLIDAAAATSP